MSTATVRGQSTRDEADIRALIETVHKAHHHKDIAAIVAPYARDERFEHYRERGVRLLPWLLPAWRNSEGGWPADQSLDARDGVLASRRGRLEHRPSAHIGAVLHGWQLAAHL